MFSMTRHAIALSTLVALSTATSAFAQFSNSRTQENLLISQAASFSCGPHARTYLVKPLDRRAGTGIRCVKFSEGQPNNPRIPRLAWYGEGNWNGATYRHVGHAFYSGSNLIGYASDIYGNGENINNNFPGNLRVQVEGGGATIRVTGAWNEEWQRVRSANYTPLPRPTTCGRYFDQYDVSAIDGRRGNGLRCVLRVGPRNTTWFGNGEWGGATYSHLGTRSFNGYGASDICGSVFGSICNIFGWGSLRFTSVAPRGFDVTGAWNERWR